MPASVPTAHLPVLVLGLTTPATNSRVSEKQITVVICTNRIQNLRRFVTHGIDDLKGRCEMLVVADCRPSAEEWTFLNAPAFAGVTRLILGQNRGLAIARNTALAHARTPFLLFVDDDVLVPIDALERLEAEFVDGADVVGAWLTLPDEFSPLPWFIGSGQLHYLGVHHKQPSNARVWGAFMGVRISFAKTFGLAFRSELGRRGFSLQSGDDSQFVADAMANGARVAFMEEVEIPHFVSPRRISLAFIAKRAFWQGLSEARRAQCLAGLHKEFRRLFQCSFAAVPSMGTSLICATAVLFGLAAGKCESLVSKLTR